MTNKVYSTRDAYDIYMYFLALKKHFTDIKYDFFKYNGKVRASVQSFETKKDKFFYFKLSKRKDAKEFILSNIVNDPNIWIGNMVGNDKCEQIYSEWLKRQQSLSYIFKSELSEIDDDFDSNFIVEDGQHPKLIKAFVQSRISIETLIILMDLSNVSKYWEKNISDNIVFPDINKTCVKYRPFLTYDKEKMKKIVLDTFS